MTFDEASEIYTAAAQAELDDLGGNGQVMQPSASESYLKGGIWYLRNVRGHLGRIGTKSKTALPDVSRNPIA
ncbi:MAG: hypothetical protein BWK73_50870 [Thiothrix lacustris]|uniref:Uncharacterized protein n=1 Tax=Thiothrix lacustris TaxID=525917 RepID=A0A1Y1Q8G2_9GAMM|nr:MAG: hypothetical protein BWK73_50870 [Thiothrix lacustris]